VSALAPAMQSYFSDRLVSQRGASPNTIAAYCLTFRMLLRFASKRTGTPPSELDIAQLDAPLIAAFLNHLEKARGNSTPTRNNRLAAIHSLFAYMALDHPEHAASIQRVLAIAHKRTERNLVTYLTEPEVDALVVACDQTSWTGRRDHAMFVLTIQSGLRISELAALTCADITLTTGANVHCVGKGRKERRTPLVPATRKVLRAWLKERDGAPTDPLFPTTTGRQLSRDAIERRLARHLAVAAKTCHRCSKHLTMHTLRHTAAMRLLMAGNDITVIALWLGHEQISTTNVYLHADMTHKQQAIDRAKPLNAKPGRYRPPDTLLKFLEDL
jgi:site-specific recombinase XerD